MSRFIENHRLFILSTLIIALIASLGITIEFENIYTDSISISVIILSSLGLALVGLIYFIEEIESICNP